MTRRRGVLAGLAGAAIVLVAGRVVASLYVEYAWYQGLGLPGLARAALAGELLLRGGSTLLATLFLFANLYAVRLSVVSLVLPRRVGDLEFGEEVPGRYLAATAAILAVAVGSFLGMSGDAWPQFALALEGVRFGERDPYFENDLGFYVAALPVELALFHWAQRLLIVTVLVVALLYALTPSVRWRGRTLYISEYVRRHLTVLGGVLLVLFAWGFRLESYQLLFEGSGAAGAFSAVDLQVRVPGSLVLAATALGAGLIVVWAGFAGQVRLAFFAVTVVLLLSVVIRYVLPVALRPGGDRARVEAPYLATREAFTRRAFGADRIATRRDFPDSTLQPVGPRAVAVWDAPALRRTVDGAAAVGWARAGDEVHAVVAQRGFVEGGEATPWTVTRIAAWGADAFGEPIPVRPPDRDALDVLPLAVVADSAPAYRVVPDPAGIILGAAAGEWGTRLAHAWALQNFRILLGRLPEANPTIVLMPRLRERVAAAAPFFVQGATPRPAAAGDTLFWTLDLYTTSNAYPLSEPLSIAGGEYRYFHPAGHAIVNAATGRIRVLPVVDPEPVVRAWMERYPALFVDEREVPPSVASVLLPHADAVRARAITFARLGPTELDAPARRRHLAVEHGADSIVGGGVTPAALRGGDGLSIVVPVLGEDDRLAGAVVASGPSARSRWIPAGDSAPFWELVLDRLRSADSTSARRDARPVRGRVRLLPGAEAFTFVQPTYLWPSRGGPTLAGVNTFAGGVSASAGLAWVPPGTAAGDTAASPPDARALYTRMREALRRGDWRAFGAAFDSLGRALQVPIP